MEIGLKDLAHKRSKQSKFSCLKIHTTVNQHDIYVESNLHSIHQISNLNQLNILILHNIIGSILVKYGRVKSKPQLHNLRASPNVP